MILTPIAPAALEPALDHLAAQLAAPLACRVLERIAAGLRSERARGAAAAAHRRAALALARSFGMKARMGSPRRDFGWSGRLLRSDTEAYVLLHEVAHFQLAAPSRRRRPEFGLGPGTETGDLAGARRAMGLARAGREAEEALASLLGILWEVELGQPALASFLDQNWLEGAGRPAAAAHFTRSLRRLRAGGFIAANGRPTRRRRPNRDPAGPRRRLP